nr:hypothetical protein [Tanacetum cinerariifolium]
MDIKFEPFEDLVETKTPESPHTVASPTSLLDSAPPTCHAEELEDSDTFGARSMTLNSIVPLLPDHPLTHTTPTLVPSLCRTARMAVHVSPAMLPVLLVSIAEVEAMSDSAFHKRFRSSYESSPLLSPPDLPLRKCYRGTSELVGDDDEEEDDDEGEDEEVGESLNFNSKSKDTEDEGPTVEDEDPAVGDEGLAVADEGLGMRVESLSLGGYEAVPEGQQRATSVVKTAVVRLGELSLALFERYDRDIGELFTRLRAVRNDIFSQRYRLRSLEHEQERTVVTFGALWRPVLALEAWAGHVDT